MRRPRFEPLEERRLLAFAPVYHYISNPFNEVSGAASGDPLDVAMNYLRANSSQLDVQVADLSNLGITDRYTDADTGVTHLYLRQKLNGLDVVNTSLNINVTREGQIINVGSSLVAGLYDLPADSPASGGTMIIPAIEALDKAAVGLGLVATQSNTTLVTANNDLARNTVMSDPDVSLDPVPAALHYVAVPDGGVKLAWGMNMRVPSGDHWYDVSVDSASGELLSQNDWVEHASYRVYPRPLESPSDGARQLVTDPPADGVAPSPFGWHDDNGFPGAEYTYTRGNNVLAQEDVNGNNGTGIRANGGASLTFDFQLDLTQQPATYQNAAITNLFYWNNVLHDVHYVYGFDEAAGNFQQTNYPDAFGVTHGLGNDYVLADAQDGGGFNNANFATPPEGQNPRMQMYLFNNTNPYRDGDLDNGVIVHEYGHGVSKRLVGGPSNTNVLNSSQGGGMGEGLGDWWALMFTQKPTDTKNGRYPVGTYVEGQMPNGPGARRYPYSFNMAIDPLTYGVYNLNQEIHAVGEIWCSILWDLNWLLINKYGYESDISKGYNPATPRGNTLALQLVMDSLKLMPNEPTFVQGRDMLLRADAIRTGGKNTKQIWEAFARRGVGLYADGVSPNSATVKEDFARPPEDPIVVRMVPTGDILAPVNSLQLWFSEAMNTTSFDINADVVSFTDPTGKSLATSAVSFTWVDPLTLQISGFGPTMLSGEYTLKVGPNILAADNGKPMDQNINAIPGEVFAAADAPPDDRFTGTFTYTRAIGQDDYGYQAIATAYQNIDLVPGTGPTTVLDGSAQGFASFSLGTDRFRFYGREYDTLYVSANGYLTFGGGANNLFTNGDLTTSPSLPTIAPLWDYWRTDVVDTSTLSDQVLASIVGNQLILEWNLVRHSFSASNPATFQAILELNSGTNDGSMWFNYPDVTINDSRFDNGADATVGIKSDGILDPYRLLLSYYKGDNDWLGNGKAIKIFRPAQVTGFVFRDVNGNGVQDASDSGLEGWTVYADADNDSIFDSGEEFAVTDANGDFKFEYLPWGDYYIREVPKGGWLETVPVPNGHFVSLASGGGVQDLIFGNQPDNHAPVFDDVPVSVLESVDPMEAPGRFVAQLAAADQDKGQVLTYEIVGGNTGNAFDISATGVITIRTPGAVDFETGPSFTLTVKVTDDGDPVHMSDTAIVTVDVLNTNDPPVALDEFYSTGVNVPLQVPDRGVLENDSDVDQEFNEQQQIMLSTTPTSGTWTISFGGATTGALAFNARVLDVQTALNGLTSIGGVGGSVRVTSGSPSVYKVEFRGALAGTDVPALSVNVSNLLPAINKWVTDVITGRPATAEVLWAEAVQEPLAGTLNLGPNGGFVYSPDLNFIGVDHFLYRVSDSLGASSTATATIKVGSAPPNDDGLILAVPGVVWESPVPLPQSGVVALTTVNTSAPTDVVLTSKNPARLLLANDGSVPAATITLTILAGEKLAYFDIVTVDNLVTDGSADVAVIAAAPGLYSGVRTIHVGDNELASFGLSPISSPQTAGVPFVLVVEARNIDNEVIETYAGNPTFSSVGDHGSWPVEAISIGAPPLEQPFQMGVAIYDVSVMGVDTNIFLTVNGVVNGVGGVGVNVDPFDTEAGPLTEFKFSTITSPQRPGQPFNVTVEAVDKNGFRTTYNGPARMYGTVSNGVQPTLLISEIGDADFDFVELQNVGVTQVDTAGWTVVINDPSSGDPNRVFSQVWQLPEKVGPGELPTISDDPARVSQEVNELQQVAFSGTPTTGTWAMGFRGASTADEQQRIVLSAVPASGTWTMRFRGATTAPLAYNASIYDIKTALDNLSTIGGGVGGSVFVVDGGAGVYKIQFSGALGGQDVPNIEVDTSKLAPVITAAVSATTMAPLSFNEQQRIAISATPTGGTWTMSFNGATTDPLSFNEQQQITFSDVPTGGTWTISYLGTSTDSLPFNATALEIKTALDNLQTIGGAGGSVIVTGAWPGSYLVEFCGALGARDLLNLTVDTSKLTFVPTANVTETTTLPERQTIALSDVPNSGTWTVSFRGATTVALPYNAGINEQQRIKFSTTPTGGTWTMSFRGATTASMAPNASVLAVQAALNSLSTIGGAGGSVSVTKPGITATVTETTTLPEQQTIALSDVPTGGTWTLGFRGATTPALPFNARINEQQRITLSAVPTGGTWAMGFLGATTASMNHNASVQAIQTALNSLSTIGGAGGSVTVTSTGASTYQIEFFGALGGRDVPDISVYTANLATGISYTVAEVPTNLPTALKNLSTIGGVGGSVIVTSGGAGVYQMAFGGTLAGQDVPSLAVDTSKLTLINTYQVEFLGALGGRDVPAIFVDASKLTPTAAPVTAIVSEIATNLPTALTNLSTIGGAGGSVVVTNAGITAIVTETVTFPAAANERQTIALSEVPTGGTWTMTFVNGTNAATTTSMAFSADEQAIQAALNSLPTIGGAGGWVTVTSLGPGAYEVEFSGTLAGKNLPNLIGVNTSKLTSAKLYQVEFDDPSSTKHALAGQNVPPLVPDPTKLTAAPTAEVKEIKLVERIKAALDGLATIGGAGGNVLVTTVAPTVYQVEFGGALAGQDLPNLTADTSLVTAGVTAAVTETATVPTAGNEQQTIALSAIPTGGTWTISYRTAVSAPLPYNATALAIQNALNNLTTIVGVGGSVMVTDLTGCVYQVEFTSLLGGQNLPNLVVDTSKLTTVPTAAISEILLANKTNERQSITFSAVPTLGNWTISFAGATTAALASGASLADITAALNSLSTIGGVGGGVLVTSTAPGVFEIEFGGALSGQDLPDLIVDVSALTPAVAAAVAEVVPPLSSPNEQQRIILSDVPMSGAWTISYLGFSTVPLTFNEQQRITFSATPTSGTWTITFQGATTAPLPFNASLFDIMTALDNLATIGGVGGSVTVTSDGGGAYLIEFGDSLGGQNLPDVTVGTAALTPAVTASVAEISFSARIEAALNNLPPIQSAGGSVTVTSIGPGAFQIEFGGGLSAQELPNLTVDTRLLRNAALGPIAATVAELTTANEQQRITFSAKPTGGTWIISYLGVSTAPLSSSASLAEITTALDNLTSIGGAGGCVLVTSVAPGVFQVEFGGVLGHQDLPNLTLGVFGLTPTLAATVSEIPRFTRIEAALNNLPTIGGVGGAVIVTTGQAGVYHFEFGGALGSHDVPLLTVDTSHLAGGAAAAVSELVVGQDAYFGANIPWGPASGKGWVMLLDKQMKIVDFVAWGYTGHEIQGMRPVLNGKTLQVLENNWSGQAVAYNVSQVTTLQRIGNRDGSTPDDFAWLVGTEGIQNGSLHYPFDTSTTRFPLPLTTDAMRISEVSDGILDYVELQNVGAAAANTEGWLVAMNDPTNNNPNDVAGNLWRLPENVASGLLPYVTGAASDITKEVNEQQRIALSGVPTAGTWALTFRGETTVALPFDAGINEQQRIKFSTTPTGGTWAMSFRGATTASLPFNAGVMAIQTALNNLSTIGGKGGSVKVTNLGANTYQIEFRDTLGGRDVPAISVNTSKLSPFAPSITPTVMEVPTNLPTALKNLSTIGGAGGSVIVTNGGAGVYQIEFTAGINEHQRIAFSPIPTNGAWTITFRGATTGALSYKATPDEVRDALNDLSTIGGVGGSVTVASGGDRVYLIEFGDALGDQDLPNLTADTTLTTIAVTATVTETASVPTAAKEQQTITMSAVPTGGTWAIRFGAAVTDPLSFNASALDIQTALNKLSTIGGVDGSVTVTVTDFGGRAYQVEFGGSLSGQNVSRLVVDASALTTGVAAAVSQFNDLGGHDVPKVSVDTSQLAYVPTATVTETASVPTALRERQTIALSDVPNLGTWTIGFQGATTTVLPFNASINEQQKIQFSAAPTGGTWSMKFRDASTADEQQRIEFLRIPSGGTWTMSFGGATTVPLPFNAGINEQQQIVLSTIPTGGTWTMSFRNPVTLLSATTAPLVFNASAAAIQAALNNLPTIGGAGGSVAVSNLGVAAAVTETTTLPERQTITMSDVPMGGTWTISFQGSTTTALPFNASAAAIQNALNNLSKIKNGGGGSVIVTGPSPGGPYQVEFAGTLAGQNQPRLVVDTSKLIIAKYQVEFLGALGGCDVSPLGVHTGSLTATLAPSITSVVTEVPTNLPTALKNLSTIKNVGGKVFVTDGGVGVYKIQFSGALSGSDVPTISVNTSNLTPGVTYAVSDITTPPLRFDADLLTIKTALENLPTIGGMGGSVTVTNPEANTYQVEFRDTLGGRDVPAISVNTAGLAPGITPTVTEVPTNLPTALNNLSTIGGAGGWVTLTSVGASAYQVEFGGALAGRNVLSLVVNTSKLVTVPSAKVTELVAGKDVYLGDSNPWSTASAKGWVMLIDKSMNIVDFVAWGYSSEQIRTMRPAVDGVTMLVPGESWSGPPVTYGGAQTTTLQRAGNTDINAASDFAWAAASKGLQNIDMQVPFSIVASFTDGLWTGPIMIPDSHLQMFLRAQDTEAHVGVSDSFDVRYTVPPLASMPGAYDPSTSLFYFRDSNSGGFADRVVGFGPTSSTWTPLIGDWNGDGVETVGLFDPASSKFFLRNSPNSGIAETTFGFGVPKAGWLPLVGDWDKDGIDTVGLFDPKTSLFYLRNTNTTGVADRAFGYGVPDAGWTPLVGDWNGDGVDTIAFYVPSTSMFLLRNKNETGVADRAFGFGAGGLGWKPVVGDWDGDGKDTVGLYDPTTAMFYQTNSTTTGYATKTFPFGVPNRGWIPLAGDWNGPASLMAAADTPVAATASSVAAAAPPAIRQEQLDAVVDAALARWASLDLDAGLSARLAQTQFRLADLPGNELGRAAPGVVLIDPTAAGRGWFVDSTPLADEEFVGSLAVDPQAIDRMDLLTVVEHELGHLAGLEHEAGDSLMSSTLGRGLRRPLDARPIDAVLARGLQ